MFLRTLAAAATLSVLLVGCANTSSEGEWTTDEPTTSADAAPGAGEATGSASEPSSSDEEATTEEQTLEEDGPLEPTARGQIGWLSVAVPEGWEETLVQDQLFSLRYLQTPDDQDSPSVSLAGEFGDYDTARVGLSTLIAEVQIGTPGFHVEETTDIDVPGATSAVRLDFVYGTEEEGGVFEGMWIVASDEDTSRSVAVTVSGPAEESGVLEDVRDAVQDSMTLLEP